MIRLNKVSFALENPMTVVRFNSIFLPLKETGEAIALRAVAERAPSEPRLRVRRTNTGEITVAGVDLATLSPAQLDKHRGEHCGMVFQNFHFLPVYCDRERRHRVALWQPKSFECLEASHSSPSSGRIERAT